MIRSLAAAFLGLCAKIAGTISRGNGVGWYDSYTHEWRFGRVGSRDEVRAAIGIDAFFTHLRIWTLEQKVKP